VTVKPEVRIGRLLAVALGTTCLMLTLPKARAAEPATLEPRVRFETTAGEFVVELDTVRAPLTSENFLRYVREGHYDGVLVHRVIPNFVVQTGGYDRNFVERPTHAPIPNESGNGLYNRRGSLGMAREDSPHSATAQFYINLADNAGLNPLPSRWGYAVFGQVVSGMDVIDRIAYVSTGQVGPFPSDSPLKPIVVLRATVVTDSPGPTEPQPPVAEPGADEEKQDPTS
jgi:cyclophilin family peptidyl-prolyl cis-trans isomerase